MHIFIQKFGIKVLVTTHSPSTIALCPEDSIYELKNHEASSLEKISKDDALQLLTGFIPTLSLDYKNHKQIFVESPTDVEFYQTIHDKLQQDKKLSNKLYFISNALGKGNSTLVCETVNSIRHSGNKTSYGIIDWDLKSDPTDNIYVHGYNERYSVENFVLDPVYLICLLLDMDDAHNISKELKFGSAYNQFSIGNETNERLQEISNYVFDQLKKEFPVYKKETETIEISYINGKSILWPKWYAQMQGHQLEEKLRKVFTALNKFSGEGVLQNKISLIIGKCYPFVPSSTVELLESI